MVFDERLAEFSRERLDGRPVPEDVRALLISQWEGRSHPFEGYAITFLEPGETHLLLDDSYLNERDRANPDIMSNCAASEQMAQHLKVIAQHEDGDCYGYWMHPDERADVPPPVIQVDTEMTYWTLGGSTFSEGVLAEVVSDEDGGFVEVAAELAELGIPITASSAEDIEDPPDPVRAPEDLHRELYYAERAKRGLD